MARGKQNSSITPVLLIGGAIAAAVYFFMQKSTVTASTALGNITIPAADLSTVGNAAKQLGINVQGNG
ncbi:MAG: hypothetical protein KGJ13_13260 [Patescibacteria group bacterium]|nr:hypothetical protein [Patescibacteria group bacterium]